MTLTMTMTNNNSKSSIVIGDCNDNNSGNNRNRDGHPHDDENDASFDVDEEKNNDMVLQLLPTTATTTIAANSRRTSSSSSSLLSSLSSSWFSSILLCFLFLGTSSFCFISKTRAFCHHSHHSPLHFHHRSPIVQVATPTGSRYSRIIQIQTQQKTHQQYQQHHQHQYFGRNPFSSSSSATSATALYFGRPDWMRRFGRIEEKRKERVMIYTSLRKRQKELGIVQVDHKHIMVAEKMNKTPQRYRVVSSSDIHNSDNRNSTAYQDKDDDDDLLKVYIFVPEDDRDANDESNVLERLNHGEIITSINQEITSSSSSSSTTTSTNNKSSSLSSSSKTKTTTSSSASTIDPNFVVEVTWIEHDRGGWSPCIVDGITRLIPIDDDNDNINNNNNNNDAFQ